VAFAVCPACEARDLARSGGITLEAARVPGAVVPLGRVTVTPGAVKLLSDRGRHWWEFAGRQAAGDWGELGTFAGTAVTAAELAEGAPDDETGDEDHDQKVNKIAAARGSGRVHGSYPLGPGGAGPSLWVMTDLDGRGGAATTVLSRDEY
jgi:hypothetical protein